MIFKVEDVIVVQIQNVILFMQFRIADCLVLKSYLQRHVSLYAYHCQIARRSPMHVGLYTLGSTVASSRLSWDEHALDEDDL